ncbi:MAG: AMP-binding protein, partial [Rhodospirillaceae bacterium]|nr:AMP-binding protein [Rhodospirillaceae bacterium]
MRNRMLDLGTTFIAAVEREPGAKAIVDGDLTLSYGEWLERILGLAAGLAAMGLKPGDRVATVLRNTWQMASLHWACQLTGLVVTPLNWRVSADELDYFIANADARAVLFEEVSAPAVNGAASTAQLPRIAVEGAPGGTEDFAALMNGAPAALESYASPEDI